MRCLELLQKGTSCPRLLSNSSMKPGFDRARSKIGHGSWLNGRDSSKVGAVILFPARFMCGALLGGSELCGTGFGANRAARAARLAGWLRRTHGRACPDQAGSGAVRPGGGGRRRRGDPQRQVGGRDVPGSRTAVYVREAGGRRCAGGGAEPGLQWGLQCRLMPGLAGPGHAGAVLAGRRLHPDRAQPRHRALVRSPR
eukprot:987852-Rhodomonas_salina.1